MNVVILLLFIGVMLVLGAFVLFYYAARNRDLTNVEQASLLPFAEEKAAYAHTDHHV